MKGKKSEGFRRGEPGVYTFAEQKGGRVTRVALEMLSPGRKLADLSSTFLCALLIGGEGIEKEAQKLIDHGADRVWVVSHPSLENFLDEAYAEAIRLLFLQERPAVFLGGATAQGRALFPRVSTLWGTGLTADCTELGIEPRQEPSPDSASLGGTSWRHSPPITARRWRPSDPESWLSLNPGAKKR